MSYSSVGPGSPWRSVAAVSATGWRCLASQTRVGQWLATSGATRRWPMPHLFLALALSSFLSAGASALEIASTHAGSSVGSAGSESALVDGPMLVRLDAGEAWVVFGSKVHAVAASELHVSASSEFISFAILSGQARVGDSALLRPGQTALVVIATGAIEVFAFDAERLAASAPPVTAERIGLALAPIIAAQRRARFWGLYEQIGLNARASSAPAVEALRRTYLLDREVIGARLGAKGNQEVRALAVAQRFLSALQTGDVAAAAALMDPAPFAAAGDGWRGTRTTFARNLASASLAAELRAAILEPISGERAFRVAGAARPWILSTVERSGATFVAALEQR
jgi:hypothetical protein